MITEYTDCSELMRLISDQKIKPSAVKRFFSKQGVIFTSSNATTVANDVYTILLGGTEMAQVTQMIVSEGNYEKSTLINAKIKTGSEETNLLDFFADGFNSIRSTSYQGYMIEHPIKSDSELLINMSYKRKLPGKNKLIQEETRFIKIAIRKTDKNSVSIDIRQPSSFDTQKALDILKKIVGEDADSPVFLSHLNLDLLTDKNKVTFFDKLSAISFSNWRLKTVTGITVRKSTLTDDDDLDSEINDDEGETGTLAGINQAVLNGSGLRSNEFVQKSLDQGYYISSMKYRYTCTQEAGEFIIGISSKGENLRVDMEKSYCDEDGTLYIQPFPKKQQDEIIRLFQKAANDIFYELISEQKKKNTTT